MLDYSFLGDLMCVTASRIDGRSQFGAENTASSPPPTLDVDFSVSSAAALPYICFVNPNNGLLTIEYIMKLRSLNFLAH